MSQDTLNLDKINGVFSEANGDVIPYQLTNAQLERLAILSEECGEVVQIIGKILRHGYESYNPNDPDKIANRQLLERELGDIKFSLKLMIYNGDIDPEKLYEATKEKEKRIEQYLHFN